MPRLARWKKKKKKVQPLTSKIERTPVAQRTARIATFTPSIANDHNAGHDGQGTIGLCVPRMISRISGPKLGLGCQIPSTAVGWGCFNATGPIPEIIRRCPDVPRAAFLRATKSSGCCAFQWGPPLRCVLFCLRKHFASTISHSLPADSFFFTLSPKRHAPLSH